MFIALVYVMCQRLTADQMVADSSGRTNKKPALGARLRASR
jgi:hypothetical protein